MSETYERLRRWCLSRQQGATGGGDNEGLRLLARLEDEHRAEVDELRGEDAGKDETLREVAAVLDAIPDAVRVREGGGPEDVCASLAVSVSGLRTRAERAEADNAELQALLRSVRPYLKSVVAMTALEAYDACVAQAHPGAALLEEMQQLREQVVELQGEVDDESSQRETYLLQLEKAEQALAELRGEAQGQEATLRELARLLDAAGRPKGSYPARVRGVLEALTEAEERLEQARDSARAAALEEASQVVNKARGEGPVDLRKLVGTIRALAHTPPAAEDSEPDPLHPNGRCTCAGEGTCPLCSNVCRRCGGDGTEPTPPAPAEGRGPDATSEWDRALRALDEGARAEEYRAGLDLLRHLRARMATLEEATRHAGDALEHMGDVLNGAEMVDEDDPEDAAALASYERFNALMAALSGEPAPVVPEGEG